MMAAVHIARAYSFRRVFAVGVGMTKFEKSGRRPDWQYPDMVSEAVSKALDDAKISYNQIQQVYAGYVLGESTSGQRSVYQLGMTGIPVYNVNNNAATGSTALFIGKQVIQGGLVDCVLAFGFEKMKKEDVIRPMYPDRALPLQGHIDVVARTFGLEDTPTLAQLFGNAGREHMKKYARTFGLEDTPTLAQLFGNAGREHMKKYGTTREHFQRIAYKHHKHAVNNPNADLDKEYTMEEIRSSPMVHDPLTRLQCCPISDGSAAVVLASEDFVIQHGLEEQAVEILAMDLTTDLPSTFNEDSCIKMVGYDMIKLAADRVFERAGVTREEVDVVELHDCFSTYELIAYEALGLCGEGEGGKMVDNGDNTYGGKYVINPSGGLISKGHPIGATGVAQCVELSKHLRNQAGKRQVQGAKIGLQHNIGLGGACVVGLYRLGFPK